MAEEIPLGEVSPSKDKSARGYVVLGIAIGLVIGVVVGYYVHVGTLQYAYKLLSETQSPPPDLYLVAYSPGKIVLMTAMGTPILEQTLPINDKFKYIGQVGDYKIYIVNNYIYVLKDNEIYGKLLVEGLIHGVTMGGNVYVVTRGGVVKLTIPDLVEEAARDVEGATWLYAIPEEKMLFVLTERELYVLNDNLEIEKKYNAGGQRLFVGAYYFFVVRGNTLTSYDRSSGKPIASVVLDGEVYDLRACRGILFVATSNKLYALKVPDLATIKTIDAVGNQLINDVSCSLMYLTEDKTLYTILVPSLNMHKVELTTPLDSLEIRSGALGIAATTGARRQIALACG